jgi:uncharacterized membrane protein
VLFDEGRVVIPLLSVTAAVASLGAIFFELSTAPAGHHFASLAFAAVTILLSWSFIQFIFAFHYAHEFYAHHRGKAHGLRFPNDAAPDYWDFRDVRFTPNTGHSLVQVRCPLSAISGHSWLVVSRAQEKAK